VPAPADDAADAKAIVAKSIEAMGGEAKLEKFNAQTFSSTGTFYGAGDGLPYTGNYALQFPDQFKMEIVGAFAMVLNGDKGWIEGGGETRAMTPEELKNAQEDNYAGWVAALTPLVKDKTFTLATIGETNVDNRPAVGVRVSADKHRDVNLYFDKETNLLAKIQHRTISPEQGNKEVDQETFHSDYKEIEGVKVAMKFLILRDGEKFVEGEVTELKPVGKLDDSVFGEP
jgi:hypothetical protein